MRQIHFKKQQLGIWRRDDGESKLQVNEEAMFREVGKLIDDGWKIETHGVTHIRGITVSKPTDRYVEALVNLGVDIKRAEEQVADQRARSLLSEPP